MKIFETTKLEFRRKILVLAGAKIDVTDSATGALVGFIKMKAFKLREEIKLYSDTQQTQLLLSINARQIIDFGATYDVTPAEQQQTAFSLRRQGLRSTFVRDKWMIIGSNNDEYGFFEETGTFAIVRRYIAMIPFIGGLVDFVFFFMTIDYKLYVTSSGEQLHAATLTRKKNPFVIKYNTSTENMQTTIDPQIVVAAGTMLTIIEVTKN